MKKTVFVRPAAVLFSLVMAVAFAATGTATAFAQTLDDARRMIDNEDYRGARKMLTDLIGTNPKKIEDYYFELGRSFIESGTKQEDATVRQADWEEAKKYFTQGLEKSKKSTFNMVGMARYSALNKNNAEAKSLLDKALAMDNDNVDLLADIAEGHLALGTKAGQDEAIKLLTRAKALNDKKPAIFIALGDVWQSQTNYESAISNYQSAIGLDPKSVRAYYRLGQAKVRNKEYQPGVEALKKALELDPKFAPAYAELGEVYFKAKFVNDAKEAYRKYVELRGKDVSARYRYVQFLYLCKDYANALNEIKIVQKDTTTNLMYRLQAYCSFENGVQLEQQKQDDAAKKAFAESKQAIEMYFKNIKPANIIARDYEYRGKNLVKEGKVEEGVADIYKCFELDNTRTDLITEIVRTYNASKNVDKAVFYQRKLIAKDPTSTQQWYTLARLFYLSKMYPQADTAFRETVKLRPNFVIGWVELARTNASLDPETDRGLAKPFYEKVVELCAADPVKNKKELIEAYGYLGFYYFNVEKDNKKCMEYLEKTLQLDPNYEQGVNLKNYIDDVEKKLKLMTPEQREQYLKQQQKERENNLKKVNEVSGTKPKQG
jgi:tetratricopeptide (TPR) repeat protein